MSPELSGPESSQLERPSVAASKLDEFLDCVWIFTLLCGELAGAVQNGPGPVVQHHDLGSLSLQILDTVGVDQRPAELEQPTEPALPEKTRRVATGTHHQRVGPDTRRELHDSAQRAGPGRVASPEWLL
jgi:hypothetical protein